MRYFRYLEQGWPDDAPAVQVTISEQQILRELWPWWKAQMEQLGRHELVSEANCIEDFCVVHWATEVDGH